MNRDHDLSRLPSLTPDPQWEQRVRLRCQAKIAGQAVAEAKAAKRRRALHNLIDATILAALGAYLSGVLGQAARFAGLFGTPR